MNSKPIYLKVSMEKTYLDLTNNICLSNWEQTHVDEIDD